MSLTASDSSREKSRYFHQEYQTPIVVETLDQKCERISSLRKDYLKDQDEERKKLLETLAQDVPAVLNFPRSVQDRLLEVQSNKRKIKAELVQRDLQQLTIIEKKRLVIAKRLEMWGKKIFSKLNNKFPEEEELNEQKKERFLYLRSIIDRLDNKHVQAYDPRGYLSDTPILLADKLYEQVEKIIAKGADKGTLKDNLYQNSVIYMDINTLKGVNDTIGHDRGNIILKSFIRVLLGYKASGEKYDNGSPNNLRTITLPSGEIVSCTPYSYLGDEFSILIRSKTNIKKDSDFIAEKIKKVCALQGLRTLFDLSDRLNKANLLNGQKKEVMGHIRDLKNNLSKAGIAIEYDEDKEVFKVLPPCEYILSSSSSGIVTLADALEQIIILKTDTYEVVVGKLKTKLHQISDDKAKNSKDTTKEEVDSNPLMHYLLSFRKDDEKDAEIKRKLTDLFENAKDQDKISEVIDRLADIFQGENLNDGKSNNNTIPDYIKDLNERRGKNKR